MTWERTYHRELQHTGEFTTVVALPAGFTTASAVWGFRDTGTGIELLVSGHIGYHGASLTWRDICRRELWLPQPRGVWHRIWSAQCRQSALELALALLDNADPRGPLRRGLWLPYCPHAWWDMRRFNRNASWNHAGDGKEVFTEDVVDSAQNRRHFRLSYVCDPAGSHAQAFVRTSPWPTRFDPMASHLMPSGEICLGTGTFPGPDRSSTYRLVDVVPRARLWVKLYSYLHEHGLEETNRQFGHIWAH